MCESPREAVHGAVAVYGAAWRSELPDDYRVTPELLGHAMFLHALPTARGRDAHREVLEGPNSLAAEQAANLLGVEQAVLHALVTGDWEV